MSDNVTLKSSSSTMLQLNVTAWSKFKETAIVKFLTQGPVNFFSPIMLVTLIFLSAGSVFKGLLDFLEVSRTDLFSEGIGFIIRWLIIGGICASVSVGLWFTVEKFFYPMSFFKRMLNVMLFLLLFLLSFSFGYGFWWSVFAARAETQRRLVNLSESLIQPSSDYRNYAETLSRTLETIRADAVAKQEIETARGNTCDGKSSPRGDGPLSQARRIITNKVIGLTNRVNDEFVTPLAKAADELKAIQEELKLLEGNESSDDRDRLTKEKYDGIVQKLRNVELVIISQFPIFSRTLKGEIERVINDMNPQSVCPDSDLSSRLAAVLRDIPATPQPFLKVQEYVFGPYGTKYAVIRLWEAAFYAVKNFGSIMVSQVASIMPDGYLGDIGTTRTSFDYQISQNDVFSLVVAAVVEFGIVVFTILMPRRPFDHSNLAKQPAGLIRDEISNASRMFQEDDNIDIRQTIDELTLSVNRRTAYLIEPDFGAGAHDNTLKKKQRLIQNIIPLLDSAMVLERSIEPSPVRQLLEKFFSVLGFRGVSEQARRRLEQLGWMIDAESHFCLHQLRPYERIKLAMLMRSEVQPVHDSKPSGLSNLFEDRSSKILNSTLAQSDDPSPVINEQKLEIGSAPAGKEAENVLRHPDTVHDEGDHQDTELLGIPQDIDAMIKIASENWFELVKLSEARSSEVTQKIQKVADRQKKILAALEKMGVHQVKATGIFDPNLHYVAEVVSSDAPKDTIIDLLKPGFVNDAGKLLKEAWVSVSSGPITPPRQL